MKSILAGCMAMLLSSAASASTLHMLITDPGQNPGDEALSIPISIETTYRHYDRFPSGIFPSDGPPTDVSLNFAGSFTTEFLLNGETVSASGTAAGVWGYSFDYWRFSANVNTAFAQFIGTTSNGQNFYMDIDLGFVTATTAPTIVPVDPNEAFLLNGSWLGWNYTEFYIAPDVYRRLGNKTTVFIDPSPEIAPVPVPATGALSLSVLAIGGLMHAMRRRREGI